MAHKRAQKDMKKAEGEVNAAVADFDARLRSIEEFLGQMFGNDPSSLNVQFLLGELRQAKGGIMQLMNRSSILEQFIIESNLKEQFEKWQESKAKVAEEAMMKQREAMMEQVKQKRAAALEAEGKTEPTEAKPA